MINFEITSRVSIKFNEAINSAITEQILPSIQNTFGKQEAGFTTKMDLRSSERHMKKLG